MIDLPTIEGGWRCILADPPWHFKVFSSSDKSRGKAPQDHYLTMASTDIATMPVRSIAGRDCHLFMWTTGPHLRMAFDVIAGWGFKYSGVAFTWVKLRRSFDAQQIRLVPTADCDLHVGLGYTTRKNAEFCLLARRGSPKRQATNVREIILDPVREHSRKPDEAYARIERYCVGPRLELFARQSRPGWTTWGNQATKFDGGAA